MHLFAKKEIDQSKALAVVFSELGDLDNAAQEIKEKAERDSELFTKDECMQYYRQALAEGGDLYLLRLDPEDRSHRKLQKTFHALANAFTKNSAADLQFSFPAALSDEQKLQCLKAFLLALPVYNPYSGSGFKPEKDLKSEDKEDVKAETEVTAAGEAGLAAQLLERARKLELANGNSEKTLKNIALIQETELSGDKLNELQALVSSVYLGRELVNERANVMTPTELAAVAELIGKQSNVEVEIFEPDAIKELGMKAFLEVAKGSDEEARLIVLRYRGKPDSDKTLALVGKGMMYDSGGYALKTTQGMFSKFGDMAGSAAVISAIRALAETKAEVNVTAIVAACENMVSGRAYRNGDIIGSMSGKTIEIFSTDAEGRLTLADAVTYASQKEHADYIVDIATLTGAVVVALGDLMTGAMSDDEELWSAL
ncbi:MAG: leucyl aminopeptidase family protein, partial [Eubacteriales bacterium]|nr:leucyl aminopeptidase family protein [Eubacteriales bacterium]